MFLFKGELPPQRRDIASRITYCLSLNRARRTAKCCFVSSIMPNDADGNPLQLNLPPIPPPVDMVALAAPDAAAQDDHSGQDGAVTKPVQSRPLMIYTRPQILHLQSSPLVKSPPDMPELKHWFGCVVAVCTCVFGPIFSTVNTSQHSIRKILSLRRRTVRGRDGISRRLMNYIFLLTILHCRFRRDADDGGEWCCG